MRAMKLHWRLSGLNCFILLGVSLAGGLFTGCATQEEPVFFSTPPFEAGAPAAPGTAIATNGSIAPTPPGAKMDVLDVGDEIIVTFSDPGMLQHDERIKEDGTITLQMVGPVKAAGKTAGELQKDILNLYIPKYYQPGRLNVTVKVPERYFYVGGEVRTPGPKIYPGSMTVTKAIQTAGDFTEFARKTAVELTRAGSDKPIKVNVKKALKDPKYDLSVFPGDKINVPRRLF
jgi:protein involved in polysaccharide export with SLBB domain